MRKPLIAIVFLISAVLMFGCVGLKDLFDNGLFGNISSDNGMFDHESLPSSMYGTITDTNGTSLYGATISLNGEKFGYYNMTGKDGGYSITGVSADTYNLLVEKDGYESVKRPGFTIAEGRSYEWSIVMKPAGGVVVPEKNATIVPEKNASVTGSLHGMVTDSKNAPMEGASVSLVGDASNYTQMTGTDGKYSITGVPAGTYHAVVEKQGYSDVVSADTDVVAGHTYTWNFTMSKDCIYYSVNTSVNYALRYGYSGKVYHGYVSYTLRYPDGASYSVSPDTSTGLSEVSTTYKSGNRMLTWKLDNYAGKYSYVEGYLYIDTKGTGTMSLFSDRGMSVQDAASSQPMFLGRQITDHATGRTLIDPSDSGIRAIAEQVKREAGNADAWDTAKALFVWLKSNTEYYRTSGSDTYTQSATEMLSSKRGDCDELSYLYISLLRAAGVPARIVRGYMVQKETKEYISHMWVEFYDGEWVPVEVASSGKANIARELDYSFGIDHPNYVSVLVDDGTSESTNFDEAVGRYYDNPPAFSPYAYYDLAGYDPMYIASCSDGTRTLVKEKG